MKTYHVIKKNDISIKRFNDKKLWREANTITDFISPWEPKYNVNIQFKALYNDCHFFFQFTVFDTDFYIDENDNSKSSINNSDRIELFLRKDDTMNPYYCLEIDPTPRVMDFIAKPNKEFDFNWQWPSKDIHVQSSIDEEKFRVEGALSLSSLKKFELLKGNKMQAGLYRAKYIEQNNVRKPIWISWVDPQTQEPNFHIKSSFGIFKLV